MQESRVSSTESHIMHHAYVVFTVLTTVLLVAWYKVQWNPVNAIPFTTGHGKLVVLSFLGIHVA